MMHCTLCHTPLLHRRDDEFFHCRTCDGLVKHPALFLQRKTERKRYLEHNNDVNDPRYRQFTAPISDYVKQHYSSNDLGLDFGSGTGPVISKVLRDAGLRINIYDPFFASDETVFQYRYDYIVSCEVFEHFFDPNREITRLKEILKPGGRLLVMTLLYHERTDFGNWYYRKDDTHVFIYKKETFHYIARTFDLVLEHMDDRLIVLRNASSHP